MPNQETTSQGFGGREKFGLITAPIVFLVILILPNASGLSTAGQRVLASAFFMAFLWITEAIPIAVTSLFPLVLFPFLQVESLAKVAVNYANSNIFLFMGGFFIAVAMQKWNLHRRIALHLILRVGSSPRRIILGFMSATAFLSMWISNTATTMMMYPIGLAVVLQLTERSHQGDDPEVQKAISNFRTALMLAIAYSASVGGIGTLIGTPPNIVFAAAITRLYPEAPPVSFVKWAMVGLPLVFIFIPIIWIFLTRIAFRIQNFITAQGKDIIEEELAKLGPMQFPEKVVAWVFSLTALAWMTRGDVTIGEFKLHGWASLLHLNGFVNDAAVAILAASILFVFPVNLKKAQFALDWQTAVKIPWGILILFGGGIALAEGFRVSGLARWIGGQLGLIGQLPVVMMIVLICIAVVLLTEITSNTATATLFMPILASVAT
ncbi:MAG: DASS family sodium-coupled anion symporter, partial [Calditrichaeota bacterium]